MTAPAPPRPDPSGLAPVRDQQMARIVALVDAMAARGRADALIAPMRVRLRHLRPARKPRFGRLLFTPLDPVIVPAAGWRGHQATVPRTALEPIEAMVRAGLGTALAPLEARIALLPAASPRALSAIGATAWKLASGVLRDAETASAPPGWASAGLPADSFRPIRRAIAAVLAAAARIDAWAAHAPEHSPPNATALRVMMDAALPFGAGACGMLGAVLLARLPSLSADIVGAITALAQQDATSARTAVDLALTAVIGNLETTLVAEIDAAPLAEAARSIEAASRLIDGLCRDAGPRRREQLAEDRASLDANCRVRFTGALAEDLIEPMRTLRATQAEATDTPRSPTWKTPRATCAASSRRHGNSAAPAIYDAALRRAAEQVRGLPNATGGARADDVRLVEILAGPEQALSLFALG